MTRIARDLGDKGLGSVIVGRDPGDHGRYELAIGREAPGFACDLILVNDRDTAPGGIELRQGGGHPLCPEDGPGVWTFGRDLRPGPVLARLLERLGAIWIQTPVWACVLIGGRSSRMGRPKHLIKDREGVTWLARTVALLGPLVDGIVLSGGGEVPTGLESISRLPDIPGPAGPVAGILAAMRWQPAVSWLVVACDMPDISEKALSWLLARRRPGIWGTLPRARENGPVEPLLAHYDLRCRILIEDLVRHGGLRIGAVAESPKIETPPVPDHLLASWRNVNTPEDLKS